MSKPLNDWKIYHEKHGVHEIVVIEKQGIYEAYFEQDEYPMKFIIGLPTTNTVLDDVFYMAWYSVCTHWQYYMESEA